MTEENLFSSYVVWQFYHENVLNFFQIFSAYTSGNPWTTQGLVVLNTCAIKNLHVISQLSSISRVLHQWIQQCVYYVAGQYAFIKKNLHISGPVPSHLNLNDGMDFSLYLTRMMYYTNWFSDAKQSYHSWDLHGHNA